MMESVDEGRFNITKGKVKRMGVTTDLCTNKDQWKGGISMDMDLVVDIGLKRSDKEGGVVVKLVEVRNKVEEVSID